jgi:hypothetical protein
MLRARSGETVATQVLTVIHPFARREGVERLPNAFSNDLENFVTTQRIKRFRTGRRV